MHFLDYMALMDIKRFKEPELFTVEKSEKEIREEAFKTNFSLSPKNRMHAYNFFRWHFWKFPVVTLLYLRRGDS